MQSDDPELWQAISNNTMQFMNLIMTGNPNAVQNLQQPSGGAGAGVGGGQRRAPPGSIPVSREEMAAIQRLKELGFDEASCA